MRNIQLVVEYDGSRYDGWQKAVTNAKNSAAAKGGAIQEKIEEVLTKMEETPVELVGAIANFQVQRAWVGRRLRRRHVR